MSHNAVLGREAESSGCNGSIYHLVMLEDLCQGVGPTRGATKATHKRAAAVVRSRHARTQKRMAEDHDVPPPPPLLRQETSGYRHDPSTAVQGGSEDHAASGRAPLGAAAGGARGAGAAGSPAPGCLMVGTGEYTTGYVGGAAADSDKGAGVVGLVMFDLRRRGKVSRLAMCGTNGTKFPGIRAHMARAIGDVYRGMDLSFASYPGDGERDPKAYVTAVAQMRRGDIATIFTPDDTHLGIALECVERGMHVLVTKPIVKTLAEHQRLFEAAHRNGVLVAVEVHKRYDPIYVDARDRIQVARFSDTSRVQGGKERHALRMGT